MTEKNCDKKNQTCTIMKMFIPGCGMKELEMCLSVTDTIHCYPGQGEIKDSNGKVIGCNCSPGEIFKDNKCNLPMNTTRDTNTNKLVCKLADRPASSGGGIVKVETLPVYFKDKDGKDTNILAGCCAKSNPNLIRKEFFHKDDGTLLGCCAHGANGTCDLDR